MRSSDWDELKSSMCLIDCKDGTGTGFIGQKCGKLYLVTCWHNFEGKRSKAYSLDKLLTNARECNTLLYFSYIKKDQSECRVEGSTLLQDRLPVGKRVCAVYFVLDHCYVPAALIS